MAKRRKTAPKRSKSSKKESKAELRRKKSPEFLRRSRASKKGWKKRKAADAAVKKNILKKYSPYAPVKEIPKELNKGTRDLIRNQKRIDKIRNKKKRDQAWDRLWKKLIFELGDPDYADLLSQYRKRR